VLDGSDRKGVGFAFVEFGMLVLLDRRREFEDVVFGCTRFKVGRPAKDRE
jgi:hypothetical protein